jgi:Ni,Fe-hydrogenase III large subunit
VDARIDHPTVALPVAVVTATGGDVLARYCVRRDEYAASTELVAALVAELDGQLAASAPEAGGGGGPGSGVGIVEGWRGTIVHRLEVDGGGRISRAKIVDPSWFNWPAVPIALAGTSVPDFPLTNKSFNLSYAGNDL